MNFSHDGFIRTTEPRHAVSSQAIWTALKDNEHIYLGTYNGWYAVRDEAFYAEDELTDGPDGMKIAPSGAECEWVEEPSYFFDLSKWQEPLLKFYDQNPDFIAPKSRRNEVISFVKGGMHDLPQPAHKVEGHGTTRMAKTTAAAVVQLRASRHNLLVNQFV